MTTVHEHQTIDNHDNDDDLDQIHFPITIVTKEDTSSKHQAHTREPKQDEWNIVDENAILRCFNLSVAAHVHGEPVLRFESLSAGDEACMPSEGEDCKRVAASGSGSKRTVDEESAQDDVGENFVQQSMSESKSEMDGEVPLNVGASDNVQFDEKTTWTPATVTLPPWALHL